MEKLSIMSLPFIGALTGSTISPTFTVNITVKFHNYTTQNSTLIHCLQRMSLVLFISTVHANSVGRLNSNQVNEETKMY